jgi:glycosyltransferase involved in cell wall biosynthesis
MRCPTLTELPPPPLGKSGWPWTAESLQLPDRMPGGRPWPRISIVTPNYNHGQFIEETIRSVLLQGYPNLEYMIFDGGSTDDTNEIIKKYEPWLAYWISEKDRGQAHAINKGFARASGDILQWINSDDLLLSNALSHVGAAFDGASIVAGSVINFGENCEILVRNRGLTAQALITGRCTYHQPGVWLAKAMFQQLGPFSEDLHYFFDWLYTIQYLERWPSVIFLDQPLVKFRFHPRSKTVAQIAHWNFERRRGLKKILAGGAACYLKRAARRDLQLLRWRRYLRTARTHKSRGRLYRASKIVLGALWLPGQRLNRYTLGAVRRILFTD